MESFKKNMARNAQLIIEDQFKQAFEEISEDKLDSLKKHYDDLQLCFQTVEEVGSYRHLHVLIPRLLKEIEQRFGITFDLPDDFIKLINSQ